MKILRLLIVFLPFLVISCLQDVEIFIAENNPNDPAYLYTQPFNNPTQFLLTPGESTQYFTTPNNNLLKIPTGSILDENGHYFEGNMIIEIIETQQLSDHIFHGKFPVSQNELLDSKWLLYLHITADGKELSINPNVPVEWFLNIDSKESEFSFYKEVTSENTNKNWIKNSVSQNEEWSIDRDGNIIQGIGGSFGITETGWYLVANPVNPSGSTNNTICLQVPQNFNLNNSIFFAISKDQNVIMPFRQNPSNGIICENNILNPSNSGIKFVLISYQDDGKHYYAELMTSIKNGQTEVLNPRPFTLDDIIKKVKGL